MDLTTLVDFEKGRVSGSAYTDEAVYDLELERVFTRAWSFLAHESQVPRPGDFATTYVGEDPVVVIRREDGTIGANLNSCRHRGVPVCKGAGHVDGELVCGLHGWTYDLEGALIGIHGTEQGFHAWPRTPSMGLVPVSQVRVVDGLVLGTWDVEAAEPSATDLAHLAGVTAAPGARVVAAGKARVLERNWKQVLEALAAADDVRVVFPHIAVLPSAGAFHVVLPKGTASCEVHSWLVLADGVEAGQAGPALQDDLTARLEAGERVPEPEVVVSIRLGGMAPAPAPAPAAAEAHDHGHDHDHHGHDHGPDDPDCVVEARPAPPMPPRTVAAGLTDVLYRPWLALLGDERPLVGVGDVEALG